jgi:hypothetical protein
MSRGAEPVKKWEYCVISLDGDTPGRFRILTADSIISREIQSNKNYGDSSHFDAALRTIAELGAEGWEMTGVTSLPTSPYTIYFKRPTQ